MLAVTVVVMLVLLGKDTDTVGEIGDILCFVQMVPLLGTIIPTERALKRTFDANGLRK